MANHTHIEWTDATWNPITGCSVISPGCANCYAMRLAGTRLRDHPSRAGLTQATKAGPVWTGEVRLNPQWLDQPLRWSRPRRIFVGAHTDLFHEAVPDAWLDQVFAVMALAPQHTFQVLTKRAERMRAYLTDMYNPEGHGPRRLFTTRVQHPTGKRRLISLLDWDVMAQPLPNVWWGVSAEDQTRAHQRIPDLLATPAAVRWLSAEPLLGPVDLSEIRRPPSYLGRNLGPTYIDALLGWQIDIGSGYRLEDAPAKLDWVVVGGESGPGARPMHPDWARQIRDACTAAGVPFLFKQWGDWAPGENAAGPPTRTEETADWFDDRWTFGKLTPTAQAQLHVDDEPTVYRLGKSRTGRFLDGVTHDAFPGARP